MAEVELESLVLVRQQGAREVARLIVGLADHQERDGDFQVFTHPIGQSLAQLVKQLLHAGQEGNAREVLRQVRDSFRDGGWERYRRPEVRQAVAALLEEQLGQPEKVAPVAVQTAFDRLLGLGLRPVARVPGLFDALASTNGAGDGREGDRGSP